MRLLSATALALSALNLAACTGFGKGGSASGNASLASSSINVASNGVTVPTADGAASRIMNGLERNVSPASGNFKTFVSQVKANLPKTANPNKATGYDQIQLLALGACSDLTTGGATSMMMTKYGVDPSKSIAANQTALVAAGVRMLDQYTGGLASGSSVSPQVNSILTSLVGQSAAVSTNTSTIAFVTVCMAANGTGSTLLGM